MMRLEAVDEGMTCVTRAIREVDAIEAAAADNARIVQLCTDARHALYDLGHRLGRDFVFEQVARWWSET